VAGWNYREELSQENRLRRSYYELLRDQLDGQVLQYALVDSYEKFQSNRLPYPFVEKRELKPRARIPDKEYECQNTFLVIFVEDSIPDEHKKYIRFFDVNRTTKSNLLHSKTLPLSDKFDRTHKYLDAATFDDFFKMLLPVDYALMIQRDAASKAASRYVLSHFHVRIDWPIADAAEDMAKNLRYISKNLYEKGDKYAEDIQKKFFEYYGLPVMVGGRRTAAIVAAQYLRKLSCISTIYAGSSESRALIRISERGVSRSVLMKLSAQEAGQIAEDNRMTLKNFRKHYNISKLRKGSVVIFQATYSNTEHARTPDDGKLRDLNMDLNWLSISGQHILPKPGEKTYSPISLNLIYS
jgi:hypothetical protein